MKQVTDAAGDGLGWLLLALGVTIPENAYFGGLFFAIAFAMLMRHWWPEQNRREIWATILMAFLVSTIAAEMYDAYSVSKPFPVQAIMAAAGAASKVIISIIARGLARAEARSNDIADAALNRILPKKDED